MANDFLKTPSERADEARQTGRDELNAARDEAGAAATIAQRALSALKARAATQACAVQGSCERYIAREPVKATLMAVAGGALLTGLVLSSLRDRGGRGGRGGRG